MSALLDIDRIAIEGARHTSAGELARAAQVDRGDPLLYVDLAKVRRNLEGLPWVASADVSRRWPGTLGIAVVERVPVGVLPARDGGWVISAADGRLLDAPKDAPAGLPIVQGVGLGGVPGEMAPETAEGALRVAAALPPSMREHVVAVSVARDDTVRLRFTVGEGHVVDVRFGRPENVTDKLVSLGALLEGAELGGITAIDLRVPGVPAVTRARP
jgi:cell division protein FtsQ